MSLRDRLRRHGSLGDRSGEHGAGGDDAGDRRAADPRTPARSDITDFDPRSDGDYHCAARGLYLRFARPAVTETSADPAPGTDDAEPARGEFTPSGRFVVQRRFGRPVVYTVLECREGSLLVRRTDTVVTGPAGTAELEFTFEPDEPGQAGGS